MLAIGDPSNPESSTSSGPSIQIFSNVGGVGVLMTGVGGTSTTGTSGVRLFSGVGGTSSWLSSWCSSGFSSGMDSGVGVLITGLGDGIYYVKGIGLYSVSNDPGPALILNPAIVPVYDS